MGLCCNPEVLQEWGFTPKYLFVSMGERSSASQRTAISELVMIIIKTNQCSTLKAVALPSSQLGHLLVSHAHQTWGAQCSLCSNSREMGLQGRNGAAGPGSWQEDPMSSPEQGRRHRTGLGAGP